MKRIILRLPHRLWQLCVIGVGIGLALAVVALAIYRLPPRLSPEGVKAFRLLQRTEIFASDRVGIGGNLPDTVVALWQLRKEDEADAAFKLLLATATNGGKLYALCGLYFTDYRAFTREVQRFRNDNTKVMTFEGCIMGRSTIAALIEDPAYDTLRLNGSPEDLNDWLKRHPDAEKYGYSIDIQGGGWPVTLMRDQKWRERAGHKGGENYIVKTEDCIHRPPVFNPVFRLW